MKLISYVYVADKNWFHDNPIKIFSIINLHIYFLLFYILLSNPDLKILFIYFKSIKR